MKAGADVNEKDESNKTPLHKAAEKGHVDVIDALVKAGADPNARGEYGVTLLHRIAGYTKNPAGIAALVKAGADPNARNKDDESPLLRAAWFNKNPAVIAALLKAGADPKARDKDGNTPLRHVLNYSSKPNPAVIAALVKAGANLNARDEYGDTSLHDAFQAGKSGAAVALLEAGADPNLKNRDGDRPEDVDNKGIANRAEVRAALAKAGSRGRAYGTEKRKRKIARSLNRHRSAGSSSSPPRSYSSSRSSGSSGYRRLFDPTLDLKALRRIREDNARIRAENSRKQAEYRRKQEVARTQAEYRRKQEVARTQADARRRQESARRQADARRRQEVALRQTEARRQQEERQIALQRRQFKQAEIARRRSWIAESYPCDSRVPSAQGASQIRMLAPKYIMSRTTFGLGACSNSSINESANDFYNKCSFRKRKCTNKGGQFIYVLDFHWKEVTYSCGFTWKLTSNCKPYEPWTFTPSTGRSGSVQ